jgi:bifunctional ADP-heptose synthase (sugar kinase/adenylyltransferase)
MADFSDLIKNQFARKKIAIVGDLVADQFLRGTIARVSREAPVFILRHDETETFPGGAANAAVNVAALGGDVSLVGLTGTDKNGEDASRKTQRAKRELPLCHFERQTADDDKSPRFSRAALRAASAGYSDRL